MLKGCDISENNPNPDLAAEKGRGLQLLLVKVSEGTYYTSRSAKAQWDEAARLSLTRGVYHFAAPDLCSPIAEANYFLGACQGQGIAFAPGDLILLDFEQEGNLGAATPADWALTWLETVGRAVGAAPGFPGYYADYSYATGVLNDPRLDAYEWYAAAWTKAANVPNDMWPAQSQAPAPPAGRRPYFIWQFSASGMTSFPTAVIPGKGLDLDVSFLTPAQFGAQYGKRAPKPQQQYKMVVDQWLRAKPEAASARLIDLPVGTVVTNWGAPTPSWWWVTYQGVHGYALKANCVPI